MANECGTILLVCRLALNDKPKRAIREEQVVVCRRFLAVCYIINAPAHVILALVRSSCSACNMKNWVTRLQTCIAKHLKA